MCPMIAKLTGETQIMQVRLIMSYDIKQGRDQEYFEFLVREFAPGLTRMGVQPTESWYTMYGKYPQIVTGGIADDLQTVNKLLESAEWKDLIARLGEYVSNFSHRVIRMSPFFPLV
jgi:hypothetical protein